MVLDGEPTTDVGALADNYSQLAGVLAGFAFTALVIYLGRERDEPDPSGLKRAISVALFSALTSLIIVAVLYTVLAGAADKTGPALTGTLVYGLPFGLSVLALIHSVALQALPYRYLHGMTRTAGVIVVVIGPTVVMALLSGGVIDLYRATCRNSCDVGSQFAVSRPLGLGLLLTGILLVVSVVTLLGLPRLVPYRAWMPVVPTYMVLGVSILAVVGAVALTSAAPTWSPSSGLINALLTVTFALLLAFSATSVLALRMPQDRQTRDDAPDTVDGAGAPVPGDQTPGEGADR
jgi:hypothetical protein